MRKSRKKLVTEDALYEAAVQALARRMRTVAELKRLLRNRAEPDADALIEAVIHRLKQQRYLDDSAYAESYAGFRRDNDKFGARRVATDLKARGVHSEIIEKTLAACYSEVDEPQLACNFLRRKRIKRPESDREAARIFRTLMRAGFSIRIALNILKNWNVDDETISALESTAE